MSKDKKDKLKEEPKATDSPGAEEAKTNPEVEALEAAKLEAAEFKDKYFRALAELDNAKKRAAEESKRERKYASQDVCDKMIDAVDIFDAALKMPTEDPQMKNFLYGFRMIRDMLFKVLEDEGVKQIQLAVGAPFDALTQHAIETGTDPSLPDQAVLKVIKNGYTYKDRVLRPAMVKTNAIPKEEPKQEEPKPANNDDPLVA
jgi:molecular chaperone GrpE